MISIFDGRQVWGATVLALAVSLCVSGPAEAKDLEKASVRLKWLPAAQFAGYYVAKDKGWYEAEGIDLTINPGGPNIIGENLVGAGTDTFGHGGGAASLLQARAKQLPIIGIGMLFQETPYRFVALPKSGIAKFADLKGKKISTWFTGTQFILQGLLKKEDLLSTVQVVPQAASMQPFLQGQVDAATVTIYNEMQVLKRDGVTNLVTFNPADMGVNLPNESIIANEKVVRENPKLVQAFLNASLRGWVYALTHPGEAVDSVMKAAPSTNRVNHEDEIVELPKLMLYGDGASKGIGYLDMKQLEFTDKFLVESGVLKEPVDLAKAVDTSFWEKVPAKDKIVPKK